MRTVGNRQPPAITLNTSAAHLAKGARFNDETHLLRRGSDSFIPEGVCRFTTHAEASQYQRDCLTKGMVRIARERTLTALKAHPGTRQEAP